MNRRRHILLASVGLLAAASGIPDAERRLVALVAPEASCPAGTKMVLVFDEGPDPDHDTRFKVCVGDSK